MKILVTGANGYIGTNTHKTISLKKNMRLLPTGKGPGRLIVAALEGYSYKDIDITDGPAIEKIYF